MLQFYQDERNRKRRFKKLNWKTPDEWLENYLVVNMAGILILKEKDIRSREKEVIPFAKIKAGPFALSNIYSPSWKIKNLIFMNA